MSFLNRKRYNYDVEYTDKSMSELSQEEMSSVSILFSENYGKYSNHDPQKRYGQNIKMYPQYYYNHYNDNNYRIAMAKIDGNLVGHAIYIKQHLSKDRKVSWVIQLVVNTNYRCLGIGTRLLHSIWGFTNYYAWGLATSNPCTVKALENATFRSCNPKYINKNLDLIKEAGQKIDFIGEYTVDDTQAVVNTGFFVDHEYIQKNIRRTHGKKWMLGHLNEGEEWLAFTFRNQDHHEQYKESFYQMIEFSENHLKEAYSRMDLSHQSWNTHQDSEVRSILKHIDKQNTQLSICDFGCGEGRHCKAFNTLGHTVTGIDFVEKNIKTAKEKYTDIEFITGDCRTIKLKEKFDLITCLYDVIGSFPNEQDNYCIIKNAYKHLKKNGFFVASVLNYELTENIAKYQFDQHKNNDFLPNALMKLKPSNIMQKTGDIFNPEYFLIDIEEHIVYRKEQFEDDGNLPAEYVIRDKRYTKDELIKLFTKAGFSILKIFYVQAGKFENNLKPTDLKAKEIFVIAQKR